MKTADLTGLALDWAVVNALPEPKNTLELLDRCIYNGFNPSTNWSQGGEIIDRMQLNRLTTNVGGGYTASVKVPIIDTDGDADMVWKHGSGPTPLIAAMRCYVASKLGDEVEIPEELV